MDLALSERKKEKTTHGFSFQLLLYCNSFRVLWKSLPIKMIIHQEILTFARVRPILTALGGGTSVSPGFLGSCNTFCYPRQLAQGLGELGHQKSRSKSSNLNIFWYRYLILTCRSCCVPKPWEMMTKSATFNHSQATTGLREALSINFTFFPTKSCDSMWFHVRSFS